MPTISISRRKEWILFNRRVEVILDGKSLGYILSGVSRDFDFPSGEHKMRLKMRWYKSKEYNFTLFNKEKKTVVIATNYRLLSLHIIVLTLIEWLGKYYKKNHMPGYKFLIVLFLAAWVFTIIFNRGNYIIIKEENPK